ncbi:MAG: class II aldolase/adducin family protein [Deltaproteobacteria bacterium]|nr:class II aldolase/adducin family protein [Deltaproteobacteria bacterium]
MKEVDELKDKMSTAASILKWELANMWGHVSVRTPDGRGFLLMHLRPPEDPAIPADDVLEYDLDGNLVSGRRDQPDEIFFYVCPYKARKDVGAVIHCHPEMAVALTAAGKKIFGFHLHSIKFGRGVPVSPWLYGIWREHGEQATRMMGESCALMIQGHGALVTGETLEEACMTMVRLERAAKMILLASPLGRLRPLSSAVVKKFQTVVAGRSGGTRRVPLEWRYYESLVKRGEWWSRP